MNTKTEMDMMYVDINEIKVWICLPAPQFHGYIREEMIKYGLDNLDKHAAVAFLWIIDHIDALKSFYVEYSVPLYYLQIKNETASGSLKP